MEKNLKKCYHCLDLPYNATADEVETRKNALVKILNSKAEEKNKSYTKEIEKIENSAGLILTNIKNNGISEKVNHCFESSTESIICLLIVLAFVGAICFFSFSILL